jgi:hypothetical protein
MTQQTCSSHDQKATRQRRILGAAAAFLGERRRLNPPPQTPPAENARLEGSSRHLLRHPIRPPAGNPPGRWRAPPRPLRASPLTGRQAAEENLKLILELHSSVP